MLVSYRSLLKNLYYLDVGGNHRSDTDGTVIYVGDGIEGMFNTPYFDQEMLTNYTVQVNMTRIYSKYTNM